MSDKVIKKYRKKEWITLSIIFPLMWVALMIKYMTGDGCFRSGFRVACGNQAILELFAWFCFSMAFPLIYYFKILPEIKKQEAETEKEKTS